MLIRVTVTILRGRLQKADLALQSIELIDWQYIDPIANAWMPPTFDGLYRGIKLLKSADVLAAPAIAGLGLDNGIQVTPTADTRARKLIAETLVSLSGDGRKAAAEALRRASRTVSYGNRQWLVNAGRLLDRATPNSPAPSKDSSPSNKADVELQVGANLEKSMKTEATANQYRAVMKKFPGTDAAKKAAERLKALSAK